MIFVVFAQLSGVTGATSDGSAKVISTHCTRNPLAFCQSLRLTAVTYIIQGRSMLRRLDDLNRRIVPYFRSVIHRQRHLRYTNTSIVQCI